RDSLGPPEPPQRYLPQDLSRLRPPDRRRLSDISDAFFDDYNPYIRHIVRRTREFLEDTIDEATGEPYLPKVAVRLFGEREDESVPLPGTLRDAYTAAEEFCTEVGRRPGMTAGFLRTMLLRRVGSTIVAGEKTA